jgi:outer membrane lipoprotein-sorting protein
MLSALMLAAALTGTTRASPLAEAIEHYRTVETYQVTLRSSHADGEDHIRYFYRKPGFVRMEFIRPHAGAVLVYSPFTRRVRLWPLGAGRFPELGLSPHNPLIRRPGGQTVDKSDVGALFENVRTLLDQGQAEVRGEAHLDGRSALHLVVTGASGSAVAGVHRYEVWLDTASQFPVKVISRNQEDAIIETVTMDALEINAPLPETLFNPEGE